MVKFLLISPSGGRLYSALNVRGGQGGEEPFRLRPGGREFPARAHPAGALCGNLPDFRQDAAEKLPVDPFRTARSRRVVSPAPQQPASRTVSLPRGR